MRKTLEVNAYIAYDITEDYQIAPQFATEKEANDKICEDDTTRLTLWWDDGVKFEHHEYAIFQFRGEATVDVESVDDAPPFNILSDAVEVWKPGKYKLVIF